MLKAKKRHETERINSENQRLLNRIRLAPPAFSNVEWQEHARISERHKRSMALHPEFYDKSEKERSGKEQRQFVECDSTTKKTNTPASAGSETMNSSPAMSDSCYSSLTTTPCPSTCLQAQYQWPGNLLIRGCPILKRNGNVQLPALWLRLLQSRDDRWSWFQISLFYVLNVMIIFKISRHLYYLLQIHKLIRGKKNWVRLELQFRLIK